MNNTEREQLIKTKLQTKEWYLQCTKLGWKVKNKGGTVIAENTNKHEALKLALINTQGE
jgi:hypothetical protein